MPVSQRCGGGRSIRRSVGFLRGGLEHEALARTPAPRIYDRVETLGEFVLVIVVRVAGRDRVVPAAIRGCYLWFMVTIVSGTRLTSGRRPDCAQLPKQDDV